MACNLGQRKGFSENDIYKINKLYYCSNHGGNGGTTEPEMVKPTVDQCTDVHKYVIRFYH